MYYVFYHFLQYEDYHAKCVFLIGYFIKYKNVPLDFNDITTHKIEETQKLNVSVYVKFERNVKICTGNRKP